VVVSSARDFGADITTEGRAATVNGGKSLHGAKAECTDLRGGAALALAALAAEGESTITKIFRIDHGYEALEKSLSSLGSEITRIP